MDINKKDLRIPERILLAFCRPPETSTDYHMGGVVYEPGTELKRLVELFPDIKAEIAGKVVIDFGSGLGYQSIGCAMAGAREVIGVESDEDSLRAARELLAARPDLSGKVRFVTSIPADARADIIFTQNAFEHFLEPEKILDSMRAALAPAGKIFIGFGPPWYAPTGAHMGYFCRIPWVQLFFSERTIMTVRSFYRSDGYRTYAEAGLGKMSIRRFERIIRNSGLECLDLVYSCIKGLNFLRLTPTRELFINYVRCELRQP